MRESIDVTLQFLATRYAYKSEIFLLFQKKYNTIFFHYLQPPALSLDWNIFVAVTVKLANNFLNFFSRFHQNPQTQTAYPIQTMHCAVSCLLLWFHQNHPFGGKSQRFKLCLPKFLICLAPLNTITYSLLFKSLLFKSAINKIKYFIQKIKLFTKTAT